jgi:hypothetical protein
MSVKNKVRLVWIFPAVLLGTWLAVRTLAASPEAPLAAVVVSGRAEVEVNDRPLQRLIGGFAEAARQPSRAAR